MGLPGAYRGFKIAAALSSAIATGRMSLAAAAAGPVPTRSTMPKTVDIVFHRDVDTTGASLKVAQAAGLDPTDVTPTGNKMRIVFAE